MEERGAIKNQPVKTVPAQPGASGERYMVGTFWLIDKYGRITKHRTYSNQLPCCVFLAVLLLIVSFILATPLSLICTVPFIVCISKVAKMHACMLVHKTVCTSDNLAA